MVRYVQPESPLKRAGREPRQNQICEHDGKTREREKVRKERKEKAARQIQCTVAAIRTRTNSPSKVDLLS